jgi:hypothetical protein
MLSITDAGIMDTEYHGYRRPDDTDQERLTAREIHGRTDSTKQIWEFESRHCDARLFSYRRFFSGRTEILRSLTKKQESFSDAPAEGMKPFSFIMAMRAGLAYGGMGKCASAAHDSRESVRREFVS